MLKRILIVFALVLGLGVSPLTASPALATGCLSKADSYAMSPDSTGYYWMYQCYKSAGLEATYETCQHYLQSAISWYSMSFASSGLSSIVKYDTCRATLPKSGGTTGSNGSTSSGGGSSSVVAPGCSGAPEAPIVSYKNTLTSLVISISPSKTGATPTRLAYTVAYYDTTEKKWLDWEAWQFVSGSADLTFNKPSESKIKVAFDSVAQNACGTSARTRADVDTKGLLIFNPPVDQISQVVTSVTVGVAVKVEQLASTLSGKLATATVLTPKTCQISDGNLVAKAAGQCSVSLTSAGSSDLVQKTATLTLTMVAPTKTITCYKVGNSRLVKKVTAVTPKCPTGYSTKKS